MRSAWDAAWRAKFPGWQVTGGVWVGPPWLTPPVGLTAVVIQPSAIQGCGAHPTTRLCLQLLARLSVQKQTFSSVLDVGCGTGVLGLAAVKLGLGPATCLDINPKALAEVSQNSTLNGVTVATVRADYDHDPLPVAELVIANFSARKDFLVPPVAKAVITSGYDSSWPTPVIPGLTKVTQVALGNYRGHLHQP